MRAPDQADHREGSALSPNRLRRIALALVASAAAAAISVPAAAQEAGPDWPQYQGGPGHPGGLSDGPAPPFRLRWRFSSPDGSSVSAAVIAGDVAIAVGREAVYGVDLVSGDIAWEIPRDGGPVSAPAVVAGAGDAGPTLLYLEGPTSGEENAASPSASGPASPTPTRSPSATASEPPEEGEGDEEGSELVAVELDGREELWRAPTGATSRSGVTVDGDTAYVGDQDGTVYAVALADGAERWTGDAGARVDVPIAVADERVIAVARDVDGQSVIVNAFALADGERLWRLSPPTGSTAASAAAADDGAVMVGLADRLFRSLSGEDGTESWTSIALNVFSPVTSPALLDGIVYVVDLGGGLYRLDAEDGERVWSYQFNEIVWRSSPVVSGRTVLLGLNDGRLVAVDAGSGHLVWQSRATPGLIGTIALSRDVVVAVKGGDDPGLVAFEHDPDGRLSDLPSPTRLEPGTTLARAGIAAAMVLAVALVPAVLARRRFGDPFANVEGDEDDEPDDEHEDPA